MRRNDILRNGNSVFRILKAEGERVLAIDCVRLTMPSWRNAGEFEGFEPIDDGELARMTGVEIASMEALEPMAARKARERYAIIAPVAALADDAALRARAVRRAAEECGVGAQTIRKWACAYMAFQDVAALAPKPRKKREGLSEDEKNMRWALNRFFYTRDKNSLRHAYSMMLKERYCDGCGRLLPDHPTFNQFRYFYRKHKDPRTLCISRDGLSDYQRNSRPLLGDGVREFAPCVGVGMADSTVCDIYLADGAGGVVGRPILTVCVDAYSTACYGYALTWEGGIRSLRKLAENMACDKAEYCRGFGIGIGPRQWDCGGIPGTIVTDMGSEYKSDGFAQIAELGVRVVNLPPYRAELKGTVEQFFNMLQGYFKPQLKGRGVVMPDSGRRGARDYRRDACLTMEEFERVILKCIIYYNNERVVSGFPYPREMLDAGVPPHAMDIHRHGLEMPGANVLDVSPEAVWLAMLPRTSAAFSREGLRVNGMRYKNAGYARECLEGGGATAAFDPRDVSRVWLVDGGRYVEFSLIEKRFQGMSLDDAENLRARQKGLVKSAIRDGEQARIDLMNDIESIAAGAGARDAADARNIRDRRNRAIAEERMREGGVRDGCR